MKSEKLIIQFAKLPKLGKVKTRLQPTLGEVGCLELHIQLLCHTHDVIRSFTHERGGLQFLSVDALAHQEDIESLGKHTPIILQDGEDLGEKMSNAINWGLTLAKKVIIVGSDCPVLEAKHYEQAFSELDHEAHVFINAEDGGYVMVGASQPCEYLFDDVPWGTEEVMRVTIERLQAANKKATILGPLWDVDRTEDYQRLLSYNPAWPL